MVHLPLVPETTSRGSDLTESDRLRPRRDNALTRLEGGLASRRRHQSMHQGRRDPESLPTVPWPGRRQ